MSKIDQIDPGLMPKPEEPRGPRRSSGGDEVFQKALDQALSEPEGSSPHRSPGPAADPLAHLDGVFPPLAPGDELGPVQTEGLMRAQRTLDTLERLEQMLGDTGRSLKEVAPVVRDLEDEVGRLNQVLARLDSRDELHPLLSQVAATAMVQSLKFNRGDYL